MSEPSITHLIYHWQQGNDDALGQLIKETYSQLKSLAFRQLSKEHGNITFNVTDLVHESFERLVDSKIDIKDRAHYLALCSKIMRQILVDHARSKQAQKRNVLKVTITPHHLNQPESSFDLLKINDLIEDMAKFDDRKFKLAEMHYFGGLTHEESAEVLGISLRTVQRELKMAKAWICSELDTHS